MAVSTRRLTFGRMLLTCAMLTGVLVVVMVLALRLGAVPFSLSDLAQNLLWLASGHPEKLLPLCCSLSLPTQCAA